MPHKISRRAFGLCGGTALGGLLGWGNSRANEPFPRKGPPRLKLGLAAYSFRQYFKDTNHAREKEVPLEKRIGLPQFLDYCAEQGCDGAELTSYYFPSELTKDFLLRLRRQAFLSGVELSGTAVGNTFTHPAGEKRDREIRTVKQWVDNAQTMGISHVRVFAGNLEGQPMETAKANCIAALEECGEYAGERGVFLGIENHGGIVAESAPLIEIVKTVSSPWVGINLDTGNFHTDDPYRDLERCAPHAVNVQIKTEVRAKTGPKQPADMRRMAEILKRAGYQGYVVLEYEAAEDPWTAVPRILGEIRSAI